MSDILWSPSPSRAGASALAAFGRRAGVWAGLDDAALVDPDAYDALWRWSIEEPGAFWGLVWDACEVRAGRPYDRVMGPPRMPGTIWFEGARLNYAENLLHRRDDRPAVIAAGEGRDDEVISAAELADRVARARAGLQRLGVTAGDRVAGFLPNCQQALVLMLATASLGAVWSSCSPDFGAAGVVDRFGQITPKVLAVADGYRYGGAAHSLQDKVDGVLAGIAGIAHVVVVDFTGQALRVEGPARIDWDDLLAEAAPLTFEHVGFDHPLFIMYSSGTTGVPKSIVHSHGGALVTHLKEQRLLCDLGPGDCLQWFTTCGWMMWNWLASALASEAAVVLYDGSPTHPDPGALWRLAERAGVTHFGTSPKFLAACAQAGLVPREAADLGRVRALLSTGSPLNPEQFDWVYANVAAPKDPDLALASISGGTDLLGCFAGGVPTLPVRRGELQGRALGMAVEAWSEDGRPLLGEKGELVCTRPFPSMPVGFWGDDDGSRYHDAYFAQFPGVWAHGDYIEVRPHGGVVIHGRSDTTLNPGGVRIGTAEIYRAIEPLIEVDDAIVVGRDAGGDVEIVLCLKLAAGVELDEELATRVRAAIRSATTPRHVPRHVVAVPDIPYTISGKKVETAVRLLLAGKPVDNRDALANPGSLDAFAALRLP